MPSIDRPGPGAVGTRVPRQSPISIRIDGLASNTTEQMLEFITVWSRELIHLELIPLNEMEDETFFRSGILRFQTMAGAIQARDMLDGCLNTSRDGKMTVEILSSSPTTSRRNPAPSSSTTPVGAALRTPSVGAGPRQPARFNGAFQSEALSASANGGFPATHELPNPDASAHYQALFSPQSPIGNHVAEVNRVSGKSLIASDSPDDDETTSLLNEAVAYVDNGAPSQRRATAPQIPINRMANLSLNTNNPSLGPSSLPQYAGSVSAHPGPMSPMSGSGSGLPFSLGMQAYQRQIPPVNPADQNPPCNTLYVGNLPIDTSEEELKAMFSKQRGYKRLCFRTKQNGPMCFVEFEDVTFATKALHELYGQPLHNSVKGGIRLSFSKNPLGVRSGQAPGQSHSSHIGGINGIMSGSNPGFSSANGPPPGLVAPPGLGSGRGAFQSQAAPNGHPFTAPPFPTASNVTWGGPMYSGTMPLSPNGVAPNGLPPNGLSINGLPPSVLAPNGPPHNGGGQISSANGFPAHMMGR